MSGTSKIPLLRHVITTLIVFIATDSFTNESSLQLFRAAKNHQLLGLLPLLATATINNQATKNITANISIFGGTSLPRIFGIFETGNFSRHNLQRLAATNNPRPPTNGYSTFSSHNLQRLALPTTHDRLLTDTPHDYLRTDTCHYYFEALNPRQQRKKGIMGDTQLLKIQQKVGEAQKEFDSWIQQIHETYAFKENEHHHNILTAKENIKSIRDSINSTNSQRSTNDKISQKQRTAQTEIETKIESVRKETEQLLSVDQKLDNELSALKKEKEGILREIETAKKESAKISARKTRGISWYQDRLGWSMKTKKRDTLSMCFTKLDLDDLSREFRFDLAVNEDDTYKVTNVEPSVDLAPFLEELNSTNNLGKFIVQARQLFKQTV
eukprot:gene432-3770_t